MKHSYKPQRDPHHRNHLPYSAYPLPVLPPLALGNFYLFSAVLIPFLTQSSQFDHSRHSSSSPSYNCSQDNSAVGAVDRSGTCGCKTSGIAGCCYSSGEDGGCGSARGVKAPLRQGLQPVGTLEDLSMAVWLMALQV